jgi:hypothetical protein
MEFVFHPAFTGETIKIVSVGLIGCGYSIECKEEIPEGPMSRSQCDLYHCKFTYYDFDNYHRLEIKFSDGKILRSNVFQKSYYASKYEVIIKPDALEVKEIIGSNLGEFFFVAILLCPIMAGILVVIILINIVVKAVQKNKGGDNADRSNLKFSNILLWGFLIAFTMLGLFQDARTFLLTLIIESVCTSLYLAIKKESGRKILMGVVIANIFSQPAFVSFVYMFITSFTGILIAEIIIWLVEALIIYFIQRKYFAFKHILALAFILNAASFGIGLLLPI